MALESAQYVNQLNASNPLSTDTVSQADDHLRLIKAALVATFPNLNAPVTATASQLNVPIPPGFIGMWSGSIATIPTGWYLCDGTNGTPNLTDRFIVGAGSTYAVGATGGAASVTLTEAQIPSHSHTITAYGSTDSQGYHTHTINDPGHTHSTSSYYQSPYNSGQTGRNDGFQSQWNTAINAAVTGISINATGAHTHSVTVTGTSATTGSGGSHENRPPYYALAYIMKA